MGISRSALRHYSKNGIVTPAYQDERGYHFYDPLQAGDVRLAKTMFDAGQKSADVARHFSSDEVDVAELFDLACQSAAGKMRSMRKLMQDVAYCTSAAQRMDAVGKRDGTYVRELPSRIMAIIPTRIAELAPEDKLHLREHLRGEAQACGWATTQIDGTLFNLIRQPDGSLAPNSAWECLYVELSSTPMPHLSRFIDGGCHRIAEGFSECRQKDDATCIKCARCGKDRPQPLPASAQAGLAPVDATLPEGDCAEPYLSGPWSAPWMADGTLAGKEPSALDGTPRAADPYLHNDIPAFRPMRMPSAYRLPSGITAAALPQGRYLCRQHDATPASRSACLQALLQDAQSLKSARLGRSAEHELSRAFVLAHRKRTRGLRPKESGFVTEPFLKNFHCPGDDLPLEVEPHRPDGENAERLFGEALFPGVEAHLTETRMLFSHHRRAEVRYEMQVALL